MKAERFSAIGASGAARLTIASASARMSASSRLATSGSKLESRINRPRTISGFDRVHARGIRHALIDQFADAKRGMFGVEIELARHSLGDRALGGGCIEWHLAAGKGRGVDTAEEKIGIGDRRLAAALAVSDRTRL